MISRLLAGEAVTGKMMAGGKGAHFLLLKPCF